MNELLFSPYSMGPIQLKNRVVMAPMTRSRALGNRPNALMAQYYEQRAGAGLLITEGTAPSPNALGYANIPGLFNQQQALAWRQSCLAVQAQGAKIFVQLMHTGRMGKAQFLPEGAELLGPSAIAAGGISIKNTQRAGAYQTPRAMLQVDIDQAVAEFVQAARFAMEAGFDGVELHGANEHLIEQFLSSQSNQRTDHYGGSVENRCRFGLEVAEAVGRAIGMERVGIRLSPYGANSGMSAADIDATYDYLSKELNLLGLAYLHHVDHRAMGGQEVPLEMKQLLRKNFKNTIILTGGFDKTSAEEALQTGLADLIAFGRPFINNPDLVARMQHNWPISLDWDVNTFYSATAEGYTDYPAFQEAP